MGTVDISLMPSTTGAAYPLSYPQLPQSTRSCPDKTHRASATGAHFTDLAVDRSKPDGFVFEKRPREAPCGIVGRFGKARFGQFPAGDIANCNQTGLAGNRCGDFMRPILATVGDFRM